MADALHHPRQGNRRHRGLGDAESVILAARIASEARGAEILVSSLVRELTESSGEFTIEPPPEAELHGLSGIHQVSAIRWQDV
jgi:class 3 adenylate cyclase